MQSDANDQSRMLLRALSNHLRNIILDCFGAADDASVFSGHHQYPITYLSRILHEAFETWVERRMRPNYGRLHEWCNVLRGILQDTEIGKMNVLHDGPILVHAPLKDKLVGP